MSKRDAHVIVEVGSFQAHPDGSEMLIFVSSRALKIQSIVRRVVPMIMIMGLTWAGITLVFR